MARQRVGVTWTDLGQQAGQMDIVSLAALGNGIVLAGTYPDGKILRSTDSGATWTDLGQQAGQTAIRSLAGLGNGVVLAGTGPGGKILRSTDYGATWTDLGQQAGQTYIWSLAGLGDGIVLAGTYPGGKILRSTPATPARLSVEEVEVGALTVVAPMSPVRLRRGEDLALQVQLKDDASGTPVDVTGGTLSATWQSAAGAATAKSVQPLVPGDGLVEVTWAPAETGATGPYYVAVTLTRGPHTRIFPATAALVVTVY